MSADKIAQIKLRIRKVAELVRLQEENLWLKEKVSEYERILKQKEEELAEGKKKFQLISALERENKQLHLGREALQKMINQMIEELKAF